MDGEDLWLIGGENHKTGQGVPTISHYDALNQFAHQHFQVTDIPYRWSAQDLVTLDKLPYIGPITRKRTNILVATGCRDRKSTRLNSSHEAISYAVFCFKK